MVLAWALPRPEDVPNVLPRFDLGVDPEHIGHPHRPRRDRKAAGAAPPGQGDHAPRSIVSSGRRDAGAARSCWNVIVGRLSARWPMSISI